MRLGYYSRLEGDAERWVEEGIIDEAAAAALLDDVRGRARGPSFTTIAILLGVICLCFAAMTFVAANWEAMPRILRVALLIGLLWAVYAGAGLAGTRGREGVADALALLGAGLFGAAIMLVGQMYHLQGAPADAVLLWAGGSALASLALRSLGALWLAIVLVTLWLVLGMEPFFDGTADVNLLYPLFWAGLAMLTWWLRSGASVHLLAIGAVIWLALTAGFLSDRTDSVTPVAMLFAATFLLIGLMLLARDRVRRWQAFGPHAIGYGVIVIMALMALWILYRLYGGDDRQVRTAVANVAFAPLLAPLAVAVGLAVFAWSRKLALTYDLVFIALWIGIAVFQLTEAAKAVPFLSEAFALALSVWLIRMGSRHDLTAVIRLGYVAFALVMLLIYFRTAGTLLGTTGFYLTAGLLMVLGAIFLPKLFPRRTEAEEGGS